MGQGQREGSKHYHFHCKRRAASSLAQRRCFFSGGGPRPPPLRRAQACRPPPPSRASMTAVVAASAWVRRKGEERPLVLVLLLLLPPPTPHLDAERGREADARVAATPLSAAAQNEPLHRTLSTRGTFFHGRRRRRPRRRSTPRPLGEPPAPRRTPRHPVWPLRGASAVPDVWLLPLDLLPRTRNLWSWRASSLLSARTGRRRPLAREPRTRGASRHRVRGRGRWLFRAAGRRSIRLCWASGGLRPAVAAITIASRRPPHSRPDAAEASLPEMADRAERLSRSHGAAGARGSLRNFMSQQTPKRTELGLHFEEKSCGFFQRENRYEISNA